MLGIATIPNGGNLKTTAIPTITRNSIIAAILTVPEQ
jgi:hypothetical protein